MHHRGLSGMREMEKKPGAAERVGRHALN
jgi:hypothetical protein